MPPIDWMDAQALDDPLPGANAEELAALLRDLNPPQQAAVQHVDGPLLILAGAGSGKTRAITRRIAHLIASRSAAAREILAITFTNKAAREMRLRVEALTEARGMWICTFHAMCARILRRDIELLKDERGRGWTRSFTIYDTHDKNQLLKTLIRDAGFDTTRYRPMLVSGWISERKNLVHSDGVPGESDSFGIEDEVLVRVYERYTNAMVENNALDFDDLLLLTLQLFEKHPGARDAYAHQFRQVLVDEYQDTNRVQYRLIRHLASRWGNVSVCGDPDQSIYAWRGADIRNILDFERDFGAEWGASSEGRKVQVIKLEQNYRSNGNILRAAQGVIGNNQNRKEKELWTERPDGEPIGLRECSDENDEAADVAAHIARYRAEKVPLASMAIFYRANFMQRAIERALRLSSIPYQIVGGVEFYQRREVRDLVAYLQLLVNPADDVACARVINVPARGIGAKSVERLREAASARGISLLAAARSPEVRELIRGRAKASLDRFAATIEELSAMASAPAAEVLERIVDAIDYGSWLRETSDGDYETREDNVEELRVHAETFDRDYPDAGLLGFLQDVALVSDVDGLDETDGGVTLMTLHAAKGLEFPIVFVVGVEEELLPHARAIFESEDEDGACEEERRLFYVGMTRAMEHLHLSWSRTRLHFGETAWRRPSRFLDEIPEELLDGAGEESSGFDDDPLGDFDAPDSVAEGISEGVWVEHAHFGRGVVQRLQGSGANARATVSFSQHGTKQLLLSYAGLSVLSGGA